MPDTEERIILNYLSLKTCIHSDFCLYSVYWNDIFDREGKGVIYLVRHGQTIRNKEKVMQGRSDAPLNEAGILQAKKCAEWFAGQGICFDRVYASPLTRAVDTAKFISEKEDILTDDRLIEMDYGPYEGVSLVNLPQELIWFFSDFVNHKEPEGMESLASVVSRMGMFLEERKAEMSGNILISTHAIAMKGALEYLTPMSKGAYWSKNIGNCGIYCTELVDGRYTVPKELWNGIMEW